MKIPVRLITSLLVVLFAFSVLAEGSTTGSSDNSSSKAQPAEPKIFESGWTVLSVRRDHELKVTALASSSASFAKRSIEQTIVDEEEIARQREAEGLDSEGRLDRKLLHVQSGHNSVSTEAEFSSRSLTKAASSTLYFRAITNGSGYIVAVESLYSDDLSSQDIMVTFLREKGRLWSKRNRQAPVEVFGTLIVNGEGQVGFGLGGGRELL